MTPLGYTVPFFGRSIGSFSISKGANRAGTGEVRPHPSGMQLVAGGEVILQDLIGFGFCTGQGDDFVWIHNPI